MDDRFAMDNRLDGQALDAALHLLDRQVIDEDGLLVCKVDDLEISFYDFGSPPAVTRILTGPAALVPRMSSRTGHLLRKRWISLGVQYADRDVPLAISLDHVVHLGSGVHLDVSREGLLDRQPPPDDGVRIRRLGELLGMKVESNHPELRGKVLDVRLEPVEGRYLLRHFVVGPGRPGSLLGYDRGDFNGPWLVAVVVERLHRHIRLASCANVSEADIDWDAGVVHLREDTTVDDVSFD
ncbi:hypothetical protein [Nocardioides marmorisolisilvae]|uniref:Uncharacterized protein n=1 Tax=Nocardioides marmorisolisilvae TaxID=1542737 RepID=A0A3N0DU04_9ACTN|nr:hypothetical protein [Nocardioides marmorisolisilvae]RNL78976.1 hypothetical protein EFL95_07960 [Nocardioides marmorisolisilvae]